MIDQIVLNIHLWKLQTENDQIQQASRAHILRGCSCYFIDENGNFFIFQKRRATYHSRKGRNMPKM